MPRVSSCNDDSVSHYSDVTASYFIRFVGKDEKKNQTILYKEWTSGREERKGGQIKLRKRVDEKERENKKWREDKATTL